MSTVLWSYVLVGGEAVTEQEDLPALYANGQLIDSITEQLELPTLSSICDTTDYEFCMQDDFDDEFDEDDDNDEDDEPASGLPPGFNSTRELMAAQGVWAPIDQAITYLQTLRDHIAASTAQFDEDLGKSEVLAELDQSIAFAKSHEKTAQKFNFAVIV